MNFQESSEILNAHTKKVWKLIVCTSYIYMCVCVCAYICIGSNIGINIGGIIFNTGANIGVILKAMLAQYWSPFWLIYVFFHLFLVYAYILILDQAVTQRFLTQDALVKISGSNHEVERKCVGVMKLYMQMST